MTLGFYATLVLEGAERSLAGGKKLKTGATLGSEMDLRSLAIREIGAAAAREYKL